MDTQSDSLQCAQHSPKNTQQRTHRLPDKHIQKLLQHLQSPPQSPVRNFNAKDYRLKNNGNLTIIRETTNYSTETQTRPTSPAIPLQYLQASSQEPTQRKYPLSTSRKILLPTPHRTLLPTPHQTPLPKSHTTQTLNYTYTVNINALNYARQKAKENIKNMQ